MLTFGSKQPKKQTFIIFSLYIPFIIGIVLATWMFPQKARDLLPKNISINQTNVIPTSHQVSAKESDKALDYKTFEMELVTIVDKQNPRFALERLEEVIATNNAIANQCHGLVHTIGRAAYRKYKVFDAALVFEDNTCGSGYIHGVVEARLDKATDVFAEMKAMCKDESGNCYHGVGHGLMYYTGNNLPVALTYCDSLANDQGKLFCSEGVFMENFNTDQTLHPTDFVRSSNPFYPCNEQKNLYKGTCYFYAPDYFLNLHPGAYSNAIAWCKTAEAGYELICLNGLGSRMMKRNINEPKIVEKACGGLGDTQRSYCIDGMMSYYLVHHYSLQKGTDLCETMEQRNKEACLHAVNIRSGLFPQ